ncbi:MAG: chromosome segregation protein SMC [Alphaproteobacteria bacterium]|nr:chromosome segregation protein SMC [Alphaproteobacteria bacterium]
MKISRLRLLGFKSFVEPTDLVIEPGLTGIVGPNGCGKSNLLEALRWVMGETSYKSMRGSAMDDVIFSGTNSRPARNSAEVTIFLDNQERQAPADYNNQDEIEITRRIEREAGSAYRINGRESRARDIKILFEDAATGARSPALVRQGQIAEIVNAKPEQRRRILEDAAGIAGLHSRRHEAELRLRAAENNLLRLTDLLAQIKSQIDSLKRQARQARRYKEISGSIRQVEALEMHLSWTDAQAGVTTEENNLTTAMSGLAKATELESQALSSEARHADELPPLREAEAARGAVVGRLNIERDNLDREAQRLSERQQELAERKHQLETDIQREQDLIAEASDLLVRREADLKKLETQETEGNATESEAKAQHTALQSDLADAERAAQTLAEQTANAKARRQSLEEMRQERASAAVKIEIQLAALAEQAMAIGAGAPDAAKLTATHEAGQRLAAQLADIEKQAITAEDLAAKEAANAAERRDAAAKANLRANELKTERETLAKLVTPTNDGTWPAIVDNIQVATGYEAALAAALGDDLDAPTESEAPVHWALTDAAPVNAGLPDGAEPLSAHVTAPAELNLRLSQIGLVEQQDGHRLQAKLQPGQRLVSRDGDLWRWDGFTATAEGTTPAAQRLAERNRLHEIARQEHQALEEAELFRDAEQQAKDVHAQAETEERRLRTLWRQTQAELATTRDALTEIERTARETEAKLGEITGARQTGEHDLNTAQQRISAIQTQLESDKEADDLAPQLTSAQAKVTELRQATSDARDALSALEQQRLSRTERIAEHRAEVARWTARRDSANQQIATLKARLAETEKELESLVDLPAKIDAKHQALLSQLQEAEKHRLDAADKLAEAENVLSAARQDLRNAQNQVAEAREARAGTEARLEAARTRRQDQARRIRETFDVAPEACLSLAELGDDEPLPALYDIAEKLTRMKTDRDRLGGVNLQADDELTVLSEQFASMDTEREDVEAAISKLRGAINKLNREGATRLAEAFENVNRHFTNLFTTLFGGGEARLEMIEGEDPLSGGLEIIAKPPGKRPTTLSLLSGGEQTLTALSLIFAVFLTNPAPICVLDEVDAPLDDANVDRFCTLMEKMAEETATRFLIITHHPLTMTRMNRLFGVTMAEKGISQLVSVDLETAQTFREAG